MISIMLVKVSITPNSVLIHDEITDFIKYRKNTNKIYSRLFARALTKLQFVKYIPLSFADNIWQKYSNLVNFQSVINQHILTENSHKNFLDANEDHDLLIAPLYLNYDIIIQTSLELGQTQFCLLVNFALLY